MTEAQDKKPLISVKPARSAAVPVQEQGESDEQVIYTGQQAYRNGRSVGGSSHASSSSAAAPKTEGTSFANSSLGTAEACASSSNNLTGSADVGARAADAASSSSGVQRDGKNDQLLDEDGYPVQTLDDLKAKGPYEKTRVAVLAVMAVMVIVFIVYWVMTH